MIDAVWLIIQLEVKTFNIIHYKIININIIDRDNFDLSSIVVGKYYYV